MPPLVTANEYLEISDYPLANPAVRLTSLTGLWRIAYQGENTRAPYLQGRIGNIHYLDETVIRLPGFVDGAYQDDGTPTSSARVGLKDNLATLYAAILDPVASGDGSQPATWVQADGDEWTGDLHVVDFVPTGNKGPTIMLFDLVVKLAAAVWTQP